MFNTAHEWDYIWDKPPVSYDIHPVQSLIALLFDDGHWDVWDYNRKRIYKTGAPAPHIPN